MSSTALDGVLHAALEDVSGPGGVLDDLQNSPDPTGVQSSIDDGSTVLGDLFGNSGVTDDLTAGDGNTVGDVGQDIAGPGGVIYNLANDDGLGLGHLFGSDTVLGDLAGDGGTTDHALSLLF
ncbi:hypothetical protein [Hansschlegelia sp.]|uniref:hypothetical protein n=1 Tax=Hansschlegelia sp. TaxID=2041892 RepID=UPI002C874E63|nr:hypothetical protein [Hansschlegelia sp.]HVI28592.1 hypothetical protein [Hansschlegelia sp.]